MATVKRRYQFRRNLPHMQGEGRPVLVTLATKDRWELPPVARDIVFECCLHPHQHKLAFMHAFVVMPDHVHLLFTPLWDEKKERFCLAEMMSGIKGVSAHRINREVGHEGQVWQREFFDHVVRKGTMDGKLQYVVENPLFARLVDHPDDYPWLWVNPELQ